MNEHTKSEDKLEVKGIKTFRGRDGIGLNATLYWNGKKVAEAVDEGNGGEIFYHWFDREAEKSVRAWCARQPVRLEALGMSSGHLQNLPFRTSPGGEMCPKCSGALHQIENPGKEFDGYLYCPKCSECIHQIGDSLDDVLNSAVDNHEEAKRFRKMCRTKTVTRSKDGKIYTWDVPFSERAKQAILAKAPDTVEFLNERF